MKHFDTIENKLVAARHGDEKNDVFIERIMETITSHATNSRVIRTTNEQLNKETFIMKLRKLPAFLIVVIVFAIIIGLGGVSYAAVKVIEAISPSVKESHVNQNGKTEITLEKNLCSELEQARSERYELKEGINLSQEDAAKYINAYCHLFLINERLDLRGKLLAGGMGQGIITDVEENRISLKVGNETFGPLDETVDFYDANIQQIGLADFSVGSEVIVYRDMFNVQENRPIKALFKPVEAIKYYDQSMQQNISAVKPCANNEIMDCVVPSSYGAVTLVAARGEAPLPQSRDSKEIQGRLIEYTEDHFTLENNGHKVVFRTPYNVVTRYNQTTVYDLAQFDSVYAMTSPEALKIAVGDSLSLFYGVGTGEASVPWNRVGVITLMVERELQNINVLRKY